MNKQIISWKTLLVAALLTVSLVACTAVQAAPPAQGSQATPASGRYVTVVGTGKVSLTPDMAEINVGAESRAATVSEAKAAVDSQMAAILAALQELGIAEKDIQTSQYSIYFERDPNAPVLNEGPAENQGAYRVTNMLTVTIRDIDQVGDVLDAVIAAGANQVYGVSFTVSDTQKWEGQARENAVNDAQARAEDLARLSGVKLGDVLVISEVVGSTPGPVPAMAVERAYGGGGIAPGELEFSTQIQVTFAIE